MDKSTSPVPPPPRLRSLLDRFEENLDSLEKDSIKASEDNDASGGNVKGSAFPTALRSRQHQVPEIYKPGSQEAKTHARALGIEQRRTHPGWKLKGKNEARSKHQKHHHGEKYVKKESDGDSKVVENHDQAQMRTQCTQSQVGGIGADITLTIFKPANENQNRKRKSYDDSGEHGKNGGQEPIYRLETDVHEEASGRKAKKQRNDQEAAPTFAADDKERTFPTSLKHEEGSVKDSGMEEVTGDSNTWSKGKMQHQPIPIPPEVQFRLDLERDKIKTWNEKRGGNKLQPNAIDAAKIAYMNGEKVGGWWRTGKGSRGKCARDIAEWDKLMAKGKAAMGAGHKSHTSAQEPAEQLLHPPENVDREAMATKKGKAKASIQIGTDLKGTNMRISTPDSSLKAGLLMQTILKGCSPPFAKGNLGGASSKNKSRRALGLEGVDNAKLGHHVPKETEEVDRPFGGHCVYLLDSISFSSAEAIHTVLTRDFPRGHFDLYQALSSDKGLSRTRWCVVFEKPQYLTPQTSRVYEGWTEKQPWYSTLVAQHDLCCFCASSAIHEPKDCKNLRLAKAAKHTPEPQKSFSQTVESIKIASASKLQDLFIRNPSSLPEKPELSNLFNNEPLKKKGGRRGGKTACTPTKTPGLNRELPFRPSPNPPEPLPTNNKTRKLSVTPWIAGKVRGCVGNHTDEDPEENIAFSSAYISDRPQGIRINEGSFTKLSIQPGKEHKFAVDQQHGLRMCSLQSGCVHVALGKLRFEIEEGGVFRIKSKEYCTAKNEGEKAAVLQIFSLS